MNVLCELGLPSDEATLTRLAKAVEAVRQGRVKKYVFRPSGKTTWIVVGKKRDYWVIPRLYCSCNDFYINVISRRKSVVCYHIIAQALAEKTCSYEVFNLSDEEGRILEEEWRRVDI
ncbi:MAG: hypothetical protein QFX33_02805 [Candidatus Nezhaarchaeota archaeon]|nr:hypothetical protein [Candidatus Nezhaarchaeota archaeon]